MPCTQSKNKKAVEYVESKEVLVENNNGELHFAIACMLRVDSVL